MDFRRQLLLILFTTLCLLTADALELNKTNQNQTRLAEKKTNSISSSSSNNNSTPEIVKFQCPRKFGYYASADGVHNMTKFWLCVNWEPHEFNCPKGTHFNEHENQCTEWISESSTREDASEVIKRLEQDELHENQDNHPHHSKHHHKKSHQFKHHHHKSSRHLHKPHPAVTKELHHLNRRVDSIDSRLDSLYAYVDSKLRQTPTQQSTTA